MDYLIYSIEDDKDISLIINKTLSKQGYIVKSFYNANDFFKSFNEKKPNMILLDMMLPDMHGSDILRTIRSNPLNDNIEIIIISANHMIMDKVDGLDLGADDYIEKPFDLLELMSRVSARARRYLKKKIYKLNDITLDLDKRQCLKGDKEIELTVKEFDILAYLFLKKGSVVSRDELFEAIWNTKAIESRTLDMHIKAIRNKLDTNDELIKTVYGIGYKLNIWEKE